MNTVVLPENVALRFLKLSLKIEQCKIKYIQPGKPVQNAYIERFNRLYREDVLDAYIFSDLEQIKIISEKWREDYNENHPHGSLCGMSPEQYTRVKNQGDFEKEIFSI